MLDIDFFEAARKAIEQNKPETPKQIGNLALQAEDKSNVAETAPPKLNVLELPTKPKDNVISDDCTTITINNTTYDIPSFYNKQMIAKRDKKTLEMVFISLEINGVQV